MKILVAAGGTGGHLFPALAVVDELALISVNNFEVDFVGNIGKIEARVVPEKGYNFTAMPMSGLKKSVSTLGLPIRLIKSVNICRKIIREKKIDVVLCTGAYLSYPAGIAARMSGIPLVLMESNVYPGKALKSLAKSASLILTAYPDSIKYFPKGTENKIKCLGNPVRKELLVPMDKIKAAMNLGFNPENKTLLVFGGSLGARSLNRAVFRILDEIVERGIQLIWQTGNNNELNIREREGIRVFKFIEDMATVYSAADLVVARSGATTVAELCVTGKPSILVPYPGAANNHQQYNADMMAGYGGSLVIKDSEIEEKFSDILFHLFDDSEKIKNMGMMAKSMGKPEASVDAARAVVQLIG